MKNWQNVELLTRLATDEEVQQNGIPTGSSIFINKGNFIQFYLKIISTEPNDYPSYDPMLKLISCFSTSISRENFFDDRLKPDSERIEDFNEYIKNKILSITIEQKEDYEDPTKLYFNGHVKQILPTPDELYNVSNFSPSPLFKYSEISFEELLKSLESGKFLTSSPHLSQELMDYPEYIFFEDENLNITAIGTVSSFDSSPYDDHSNRFKYNFDGFLKYTTLEENDYKHLITTDSNILYSTTELMNQIDKKLKSTSNSIQIGDVDDEVHDKEASFIKHLINKLQYEKLLYDEKDIVNFHTAMKTSNLVILSGMSGTGKSQLVKSYASALNLNHEFKFISVNPSWTDDSDIIGFPDTLNMVYKPDDHGLIETLINASKNTKKLYIICFDEMNLARIEHYFSQFLSLLESDESNRVLRLYSKELEGRLYNSEKYKPSIKIGQNVRFVGTVNIDDSTHHFSDKVLDRANLISLSVMPFADLAKITRDEKENLQTDEDFANLYAESFMNRDKQIELDDITIEFLQRLHDLLSEIGKQTGIGPRIVRQIDSYMKNIPKKVEILESAEALDLQVVQRILSKLRGSQEQLEDIIGQYDHSSNAVKNSRLIELLDAFKMISEFKSSKKLISDKVKELELHGYTF